MKILVIGATKGIGLEVVKQGLQKGHEMRAFARSADDLAVAGAEAWAGDATNAEDVAPAVVGVDAVIVTLGVPKSLQGIAAKTTLFSDATRALLPAMQAAGVRRLLVVTGVGTGDSITALSAVERLAQSAVLGRAYADKAVQEDLIKTSETDWTIARPGILTNGATTGQYNVLTDTGTWRNGIISRGNVAHFLIDAAETGHHVREAPVLVN